MKSAVVMDEKKAVWLELLWVDLMEFLTVESKDEKLVHKWEGY